MIKVMLDSGAYSSWTKGVIINPDDYIEYIKSNQHLLDGFINLDKIPRSVGMANRAAKQSYQNQQKMKRAGLSPIPVFHPGEDFDWLKRYLTNREPRIALSVKGNQYEAMDWLDDCFTIIGKRPVRVHALGTNSGAILHQFAFETVDASTWLKQAALGQIPIPSYSDGRPNYSLKHRIVSVTDRSFARGNHVERLRKFELDRVHRFLNDEVGIALDQIRQDAQYPNRQKCWLTFLKGLEASCGKKIVPVSMVRTSIAKLLVEYGFEYHLLSYAKLKDAPKDALKKYVKFGC
jgi:hypothetical protein